MKVRRCVACGSEEMVYKISLCPVCRKELRVMIDRNRIFRLLHADIKRWKKMGHRVFGEGEKNG